MAWYQCLLIVKLHSSGLSPYWIRQLFVSLPGVPHSLVQLPDFCCHRSCRSELVAYEASLASRVILSRELHFKDRHATTSDDHNSWWSFQPRLISRWLTPLNVIIKYVTMSWVAITTNPSPVEWSSWWTLTNVSYGIIHRGTSLCKLYLTDIKKTKHQRYNCFLLRDVRPVVIDGAILLH